MLLKSLETFAALQTKSCSRKNQPHLLMHPKVPHHLTTPLAAPLMARTMADGCPVPLGVEIQLRYVIAVAEMSISSMVTRKLLITSSEPTKLIMTRFCNQTVRYSVAGILKGIQQSVTRSTISKYQNFFS